MSFALTLTKIFTRYGVKTRLRHLNDPIKARNGFARAARLTFRAPPFAWYRPVALASGLNALWIEVRPATRPTPADKVILYFHGGGFIVGAPETHKKMLARLSLLTGIRVLAPEYRKAPEHRCPAAVEDCVTAYLDLLDAGYAPENIIIGGDSAGGGLCFSLLAAIEGNHPLPRAVFTFSPIVDLRFLSPSFDENQKRDPMLPSERRDLVLDHYLGGDTAQTVAASPILHEFKAPPACFFQFSSTEILRDESLRMAEKLRAAGGEVTLDEWPDAPHVWVILDGWIPEAREGLKRAAAFITQQFEADGSGN